MKGLYTNIGKELTKGSKRLQKQLKRAGVGYTREPIPAKLKNEVRKRAGNKCEYPKCTIRESSGVTLQFHHKDFRNNHNSLSNIELLCATHHGVRHKESSVRRVYIRDALGRRIGSKIVKKHKKRKKSYLCIKLRL